MIVTKIQGGLGNQIFQWAYGFSLSLKYKVPQYLDLSFYKIQNGVTKRTYSLNKFPNLIFSEIKIPHLDSIRVNDDFVFRDLKIGNNNYYLDGYWQSEKYFKDHKDEIKNSLKINEEKFKKYDFDGSVSIHIRRTDYLTSNGYHPVQTIEYYKNALDIIGGYGNLYVFSDDINWCKTNLKFKNMVFVEGNDDVDDLWIMSMCENNIITNSSFSWWGAWLNNHTDKKIIAPKKWFGEGVKLNTKDIIPENWIII